MFRINIIVNVEVVIKVLDAAFLLGGAPITLSEVFCLDDSCLLVLSRERGNR